LVGFGGHRQLHEHNATFIGGDIDFAAEKTVIASSVR